MMHHACQSKTAISGALVQLLDSMLTGMLDEYGSLYSTRKVEVTGR